MKLRYYISKMFFGGLVYYCIEIIYRGYSHWTMFILGGLCFTGCGIINDKLGADVVAWKKMVLCMILITVLELLTGLIVNYILDWSVWNYSSMPLHILGQICVPFMFLWFFLSFPALLLNNILKRHMTQL